MFKLLYILFIFLIIASCNSQDEDENENVTTPQEIGERKYRLQQKFWDSLPQPEGYVNDYENIYSITEATILDSLISDFEKRTTI